MPPSQLKFSGATGVFPALRGGVQIRHLGTRSSGPLRGEILGPRRRFEGFLGSHVKGNPFAA